MPSAKSKPPKRTLSGRPVARKPPSRTGWWITGAIIVVVALAAIIAVVAGGNDTKVAAGVEQFRAVHVTGTPLQPLPDSGADPAIGQVAPAISGQSFDGTAVTVRPNAVTLLVFLAHWCPHCQAEVPRLVDWHAGGGVPAAVQVVGIATGTTSSRPNYPPSSWLDRENWPWPVIADSKTDDAGNAMGVTTYPYFVLLDAQGKVVQRQSGEIDPTALADQIAAVLAG